MDKILTFNPKTLEKQLIKLSHKQQVLFAVSCCERLFPNYVAFSQIEKWGDPQILRQALDEIWHFLVGNSFSLEKIKDLKRKCNKVIPKPEDFDSIYTSSALDAGVSVAETLTCCHKKDTKRIVGIASLCRDTVDMFIQLRDDMEAFIPPNLAFEEKILRDPLMIRELQKQQKDIDFLINCKEINLSTISDFRETVLFNGKSNIDL